MTKISDIKSGSVFEVPLEKGNGFAYVKLIFTKDINHDIEDNLIVKTYDYHSKEKLDILDKLFFESDKLLFFPWCSLGLPPLRGQKKWRLLGYADLTDEDKIIPDYLSLRGGIGDEVSLEESIKSEYGICYIEDLGSRLLYTKTIDKVEHLGNRLLRSPSAMVETLTLYYAKKEGKSLRDVYTEDELNNNFWIEINWNLLLADKVDINSKPKLIRLKAIEN